MAYVFASLDGARRVECGDSEWHSVLETARGRDWEPEGTTIDYEFQVEEVWDDKNDYTWNLMLAFQAHMMALGWNGSYTEKENQVISESDAYALYLSLDRTSADGALLELLSAGAVRICDV